MKLSASSTQSTQLQLAKQLADLFAPLPQVESVALAGSLGSGTGTSDSASDIDLYIYTRGEIPLADRSAIVERSGGASRSSLNLNYWGPGDEWLHKPSDIEIDLVYFDTSWMENQISSVIEKHQASMGYTTCFWHTIHQSLILFDRHDWIENLQKKCRVEYPEALRRNIITLNHPVLRGIIPSYAYQIEKAAKRRDLVSINHRTAALLASYFDILFALNRCLHPGEKRMVEFALNNCKLLPTNMEADIESILLLDASSISDLPARTGRLLDNLDQMLINMGL